MCTTWPFEQNGAVVAEFRGQSRALATKPMSDKPDMYEYGVNDVVRAEQALLSAF
jgi:hypothetical protein